MGIMKPSKQTGRWANKKRRERVHDWNVETVEMSLRNKSSERASKTKSRWKEPPKQEFARKSLRERESSQKAFEPSRDGMEYIEPRAFVSVEQSKLCDVKHFDCLAHGARDVDFVSVLHQPSFNHCWFLDRVLSAADD